MSICGKIGSLTGALGKMSGTALLLIALAMAGCVGEKSENNGQVGSQAAEKGEAARVVSAENTVAAQVGAGPQSCDGKILKVWERGDALHSVRSNLLWIDTACGERVVAIRSIVGRDTLEKRFVLRDSAAFAAGQKLPTELSGATVLRTPLQRVVALSSAHIGYMLRLGLENRIVAVGEGKYIADSALYYRVAGAKPAKQNSSVILSEAKNPGTNVIAEVGNGTSLDLEKLIALKPDLVMTFATGGSQDDYSRMEALGLPVMLTSEWQENSVDAKADWIKLFTSLFGVEIPDEKKVPESVLDPIVYGYPAGSADPCVERKSKWVGRNGEHGFMVVARGPRVLAGMSYGGVWYAPGGRSYTADLIRKAGGCYLWASDTTRELRLTIEEVIALADSADVWINPGMFGTAEEILAAEPRAVHIKAFRDRKVFQNDGRKGPGGGNDFYEGAVARPRELESNLRHIFTESYNRVKANYVIDEAGTPRLNEERQAAKKPVSGKSAFEWYHNIF